MRRTRIHRLVPLLICLGVQSCAHVPWSTIKPVPVEAVDARGIGLDRVQKLERGDQVESVIFVLGEPADRQTSCVPAEVVWRYPLRAWNDIAKSREIVPAVLLRTTFDASGTLTDWGFVDPRTARSLAVLETPDSASRWFESLKRLPPPIPPRVVLDDALIRGRTTQVETERLLGEWRPDLHCGGGGPVPVVRKMPTDHGSVWDWYVDRPSPLFVPPRYLVAAFDVRGTLIGWHFEQTYPGGRE